MTIKVSIHFKSPDVIKGEGEEGEEEGEKTNLYNSIGERGSQK